MVGHVLGLDLLGLLGGAVDEAVVRRTDEDGLGDHVGRALVHLVDVLGHFLTRSGVLQGQTQVVVGHDGVLGISVDEQTPDGSGHAQVDARVILVHVVLGSAQGVIVQLVAPEELAAGSGRRGEQGMLAFDRVPAILNHRIVRVDGVHHVALRNPLGHDEGTTGRRGLQGGAVGGGGAVRVHQGLVQVLLDRVDVQAEAGVEVDVRARILELELDGVLVEHLHADLSPVSHFALEVLLRVLHHDRIEHVGSAGVGQLRVDLHLDGVLVGVGIDRGAVGPLEIVAELHGPGHAVLRSGRQLGSVLRNELQLAAVLSDHRANEGAQVLQAGRGGGRGVHVRVLGRRVRRPAVQDVVRAVSQGDASGQHQGQSQDESENLLHEKSLLQ